MSNDKSREYHFVTTWQINASIEDVWNVLVDFEHWPKWWKGLKKLSKVRSNNQEIYDLTIGYFIYFLTFQFYIEKSVPPRTILLRSTGDLEGTGLYELSEVNNVTTVTFSWEVSVTKPWVVLASKYLRPFFQNCHDLAMKWFAKGMAKQMNRELLRITYK